MVFITLALRIGWGYLLMFFFYVTLGGPPALLGHHIIRYLPPISQFFIFTLVKIYYTFIAYHLMGCVILQYHENIGYKVAFEDFKDKKIEKEQQLAASDDPNSRLLRRVNQLIKDGNHQGAIEIIESETAPNGITDPLLAEKYYTLLKMVGAAEKLVAFGQNYIDLLVRGDNKNKAIDLYLECLSKHPEFLPAAKSLFKVGSWLNETQKSKEAIATFSKLTKGYPEHPLVPKSYFRAAQIFNDQLLNPKQAKKILTGLMKKYPAHDIIPFIEHYLGELG
jgi:TolA-binding protein